MSVQPGRRISVEDAGYCTPVTLGERSESGGASSDIGGDDSSHSRVHVEDDGASGVGTAAAAAVSVALARSWAAAANQVTVY